MPLNPEATQRLQALREKQEQAARNKEAEIDALVARVNNLRSEVDEKVRDWQQACGELQRTLRAASTDDSILRYRNYATLQVRLAGAMTQAVRRAESGDRYITVAKAEKEEARKREAQKKALDAHRESKKVVERSLVPKPDDYEFLYAEFLEEKSDAAS